MVQVDKLSTRTRFCISLFFDRLVDCSCALHAFRKFTDMIDIVFDFNVVIIYESAVTLNRLLAGILDCNTTAIGNSEQVVVFRINEADTLPRTLQMAV